MPVLPRTDYESKVEMGNCEFSSLDFFGLAWIFKGLCRFCGEPNKVPGFNSFKCFGASKFVLAVELSSFVMIFVSSFKVFSGLADVPP